MTSPVRRVAEAAKRASRTLSKNSPEQRDSTIRAAAELVEQNRRQVIEANSQDLAAADAMFATGEITSATYERLRLTEKKIVEMAKSMLAVAELPDPTGLVLQRTELDQGLVLEKITCPLGVLAVIFEARPDAVTQISALGVKSANAIILKAGREVERTASALVAIIRQEIGRASCRERVLRLV